MIFLLLLSDRVKSAEVWGDSVGDRTEENFYGSLLRTPGTSASVNALMLVVRRLPRPARASALLTAVSSSGSLKTTTASCAPSVEYTESIFPYWLPLIDVKPLAEGKGL